MARTDCDRVKTSAGPRILAGILAALIVITAGCAITGHKLVLTAETTLTPCLPTPSPDPCLGD